MSGITTHAMKKLAIVSAIAALVVILVLALWPRFRGSNRSTTAYVTTMQVSGTTGAAFSGEYVRDGKRVAFSGVVPWSLTESNISRLEIRKAKTEDALVLDARGGGSRLSAPASPGTKGLRVEMDGGWSFETLR